MRIFISHKKEDAVIAVRVSERLAFHKHEVYLDVIDQVLNKTGDDLTEYLRQRLDECNSLLAVISEATKTSWWVPWEIGVATEKDYPLSTYLSETTQPPEYLRKWPVLRNMRDLESFATLAKDLERDILIQRSLKKSLNEARRVSVPNFHRNLKTAIGQLP